MEYDEFELGAIRILFFFAFVHFSFLLAKTQQIKIAPNMSRLATNLRMPSGTPVHWNEL